MTFNEEPYIKVKKICDILNIIQKQNVLILTETNHR